MSVLLLVVDDDVAIRSVISEALQMEGYQVAEARHGQEALDLLAQVTPSGMIVDLNMPVMDGATLIREVRQRGLAVPCIVATATTMSSVIVDDLDVATVITKPFELEQLLAAVHEHCGPPTPAGE